MTNIQEVVLQIKDKNVKWENNVEEVYFKKKKAYLSSLPIPIAQMLALTVVV
ncbi:transposase, ISSmi5 [Streptococcus australis]|uniref:Transposase, ISSmi5 n=1 Tax=Streptococcus australis TaxID=113107 RepID=A0A4V0BSM7_9STRE|nr:transposase, ISSmi5 [Streptococcus australis]